MKCNRTACNNDHDGFWNPSTQAFYCARCARKINETNKREDGSPLCQTKVVARCSECNRKYLWVAEGHTTCLVLGCNGHMVHLPESPAPKE